MSNTHMKFALIVILAFSSNALADELFLHVKHLGVPPEDDCNLKLKSGSKDVELEEGEELVCWQFYSWHSYKAKIKEVIYGNVEAKTISFAVYAHTEFNKEYLRDFYVRLKPLEKDRKDFLKVKYYAIDHESPEKTICLKEKLPDKYNREYLGIDGEYYCYYSEELGSNS